MADRKTTRSRKMSSLGHEELRVAGKVQQTQIVAGLAGTLIRYAAFFGVIYFGVYRTVGELAGEKTTANVLISLLTDFRMSHALAWTLAAGTTFYGLRERKLRRDSTARQAKQNRLLERKLDPHRSSSKLTERGETNPHDRLP